MKNCFLLSILFCFFTLSAVAQDQSSVSIPGSCKDCCKDCYGQLCIHNKCKDCCKDCFGQFGVPDGCKDCLQDCVPADSCKDCGGLAYNPNGCNDCYGGINGKIDLAPAFVHVDVLESGETVHRMDMFALKADIYYRIWSGLVVKPNVIWARRSEDQTATIANLGLGFCCPFKQVYTLTPIIGYSWGYMKTRFTREHPVALLPDNSFYIASFLTRETFRSHGPFVAIEGSWKFCPQWRVVFNVQYGWSNTVARIDTKGLWESLQKSSSKGPSYSAMIEHDLTDCWSINFGAAYNISLSKEKHGLRAAGCKLGIAYWF